MQISPEIQTVSWLRKPQWLFVCGSLIAAVVALIAEGPGQYIGLALLLVCVVVISVWSLAAKPPLGWAAVIVSVVLITLGWTVGEPEPALFQSILLSAAVGWQINRLAYSIALLVVLALAPLLGSLGPNLADWGWWNWSVGTVFTWCLGRVIRLLDQTLSELTEARSLLIDSAAREERLRISRDVHDLVGHSLTAMLLNVRAAQRALAADRGGASRALADAEQVGTEGIADIRSVLVDLRDNTKPGLNRPDSLSSLPDGKAALQLLAGQEHISVSTTGAISDLQGPLAVAIYRVLQECITNISKHAPAGSAFINLEARPEMIVLSSGNALRAGYSGAASLTDKTLGLISMRERVTSLGGTFSAGAEGTNWLVKCRIPRYG